MARIRTVRTYEIWSTVCPKERKLSEAVQPLVPATPSYLASVRFPSEDGALTVFNE